MFLRYIQKYTVVLCATVTSCPLQSCDGAPEEDIVDNDGGPNGDSDTDTDDDTDTTLPGIGEACTYSMEFGGFQIGFDGVCKSIFDECESGLIPPGTTGKPLCDGLLGCCINDDVCESMMPGLASCYSEKKGCPKGVTGQQFGCPNYGYCCFAF